MIQCERMFGKCHEWMSEALTFTEGKKFGFEDDEWGTTLNYRPLRDVLTELIRESATKSNFNLRYSSPKEKVISQACNSERFLRNERKLLGPNQNKTDFSREKHPQTEPRRLLVAMALLRLA